MREVKKLVHDCLNDWRAWDERTQFSTFIGPHKPVNLDSLEQKIIKGVDGYTASIYALRLIELAGALIYLNRKLYKENRDLRHAKPDV